MAEDANVKDKEASAPAGGSKRKALLGGVGALLVVGVAFAAAAVVRPASDERPRLKGPFVAPVLGVEEDIQANLDESGRKRYLQMQLDVVYEAYAETYATQRMADPLYAPYLKDAILSVAKTKTLEQVFDRVEGAVFMEELRSAMGPILFPVHVGKTARAVDVHPASGLRPGLSAGESSFRGRFHEHVLHVDGPSGTVRLDDGPTVPFDGDELDLEVRTAEGEVLFLDVSTYSPTFQGTVPVGVHGHIRQILAREFLAQ